MSGSNRFDKFTRAFSALLQTASSNEAVIAAQGASLLAELVATDDWLPEEFTRTHPDYYQQYLLYRDPRARFSVVSFVWGPGQCTPVHDHTVWGLIGVLRGAESAERFELAGDGLPMRSLGIERLERGAVDFVSPTVGDIHRVSNDVAGRVSISIHVYGADIGQVQRSVFDPQTGARKSFVSGYANASAL